MTFRCRRPRACLARSSGAVIEIISDMARPPVWPGHPAPQPSRSRVEAALQNIMALVRPGQDGVATVWDGNKYVQCGRRPDRSLRCEAAGALMQPSLGHVLVAERIARLAALGWHLDPSFGNYVQSFPPDMPIGRIVDKILQALAEGYGADLADLEVQSTWVASEPCPPCNGPSQNLAGIVSNAPSMAATAVHACAYRPQAGSGAGPPRGLDGGADRPLWRAGDR